MELVGKRKRGREIVADPSFKFIYVYWSRHDYRHWYQFGWVPVTVYAMNLPGFLAGRSLLTPLDHLCRPNQ